MSNLYLFLHRMRGVTVRGTLLVVELMAGAAVQTGTRAGAKTVTLKRMVQDMTAILSLSAPDRLTVMTMRKRLRHPQSAGAVPQKTRKSKNRMPATLRMRSRANPSRPLRMQEVTLKTRPPRERKE